MKKNIVKNGTKVILFALGTEDTSVTGVITGHPDCIRKDGFIVSVPGFVR